MVRSGDLTQRAGRETSPNEKVGALLAVSGGQEVVAKQGTQQEGRSGRMLVRPERPSRLSTSYPEPHPETRILSKKPCVPD